MNFLRNTSVLVLGLGESGLACAQFAHRCAAQVRVADSRAQAPGLAAVQSLDGVTVHLGEFTPALLDGIAQMVLSPGLSPHRADVAALLAAAKAQGVVVCSEFDWFSQALTELKATQGYEPRVLAVTGTNGKTTVTELTTHLCVESGFTATAAGNISPAALSALVQALDANALPQVWVLELSSFQLYYTQSFAAHAAVVLNLSQDHLDWHLDAAEYAASKARVFAPQTLALVNRDDAAVLALHPKAAHSFGLNAPSRIGDVGVVHEGGLAWLAHAVNADPDRKLKKNELPEVAIKRLMPADALRLRGGHNHSNALAAMLLARAAGVGLAQAMHALRSFDVAPNRCELLHVIADVEYINDSKGTNVGATVAALKGLGNAHQRLILLAGGVGKGQDFAPLTAAVAQQCKAVITFGQDGPVIAAALTDTGVALHSVSTLEEATKLAATLASTGDAVLMSPACASFDQFDNYQHRADVFRAAVQTLAQDAGSVV